MDRPKTKALENDPLLESETELIRRLRQGDPAAFHRLVDDYANRLYGLAFSLLRNADDAEDAVQETLSGAFRGIKGFEQRARLWTWLARILVRQVARLRRSTHSIRLARLDAAADETDHPQVKSAAGASDARMDVSAALDDLAPEHREIVVLRELQRMSYNEIAEVLGIPLGTVESRLYRAREELRRKLGDYRAKNE